MDALLLPHLWGRWTTRSVVEGAAQTSKENLAMPLLPQERRDLAPLPQLARNVAFVVLQIPVGDLFAGGPPHAGQGLRVGDKFT